MKMFVPITKVDAVQRLVYGTAAVEELDKTNEIFDYASSKPNFQAWSQAIAKTTNGLSLGNVRAMHGNVAAGKLTSIDFDDVAKSINICSKIVDDNEWAKVEQGVYTGYSVGGSYERRWTDGAAKRYTAKPSEISIVDNPCMPSATFEMFKADGVIEQRHFTSIEKAEPTMCWRCNDPKHNHAKKADAQKCMETGGVTKVAIVSLPIGADAPTIAKLLEEQIPGLTAGLVKLAADQPEALGKGLYTVSTLADALSLLNSVRESAVWEAESEGDNSTIPQRLKDAVTNLASILVDMTREETAELTAKGADMTTNKDATATAGADDLKKVVSGIDELTKAVAPLGAALTKVSGEVETLSKSLNGIDERLKVIEKQPAGGAPVGNLTPALAKGADTVAATAGPQMTGDELAKALAAMAPADRVRAVMAAAMANPLDARTGAALTR